MKDLKKETFEALESLKEEIDLLVKENKYYITKNERIKSRYYNQIINDNKKSC
jgi:regulator of replication initiation timing